MSVDISYISSYFDASFSSMSLINIGLYIMACFLLSKLSGGAIYSQHRFYMVQNSEMC